MKIVTSLIVAICAGVAFAQLDRDAVILKQNYNLNPDGSYDYNFETSNGIRTDGSGYLKNPGSPSEAHIMQGSYSYGAPDNGVFTVSYVADENGYHAGTQILNVNV